MSDTLIDKGQVWRRKSDGTLVTIDNYSARWDDCHWKEVDGTKQGSVYAVNLRNRYELVEATSD